MLFFVLLLMELSVSKNEIVKGEVGLTLLLNISAVQAVEPLLRRKIRLNRRFGCFSSEVR